MRLETFGSRESGCGENMPKPVEALLFVEDHPLICCFPFHQPDGEAVDVYVVARSSENLVGSPWGLP